MPEPEKSSRLIEVRASMSGVFYRRPAPDQPSYAEEGDRIKKKQVLGLLETMKVFQKIKAPVDGKVLRIIAENETALKDDELIMIIEKI
jgi:acetyl-CoA carboxylase biotin carboxyl carrier protein